MAEVVVFDIDAASAIQKLAQLRESTLLLKEEQKRLAEEVKKGNTESAKSYEANAIILKNVQNEQRNLSRQVEGYSEVQRKATDTTNFANNSIQQNRELLKQLTAQYINLKNPSAEATDQIKRLSDQLKVQESAIGDNRREVGNYQKALLGATADVKIFGVSIGSLVSTYQEYNSTLVTAKKDLTAYITGQTAADGATKLSILSTGGLSAAMRVLKIALISTGIGAFVVLLGSLIAAFATTEKGVDLLEDAMAALSGIVQSTFGEVQKLGDKLIDIFSNPKKAITDLIKFLQQNLVNRLTGFKVALDGILEGDTKKLTDGILQISTGITNLTDKAKKAAEDSAKFFGDAAKRGQQIVAIEREIEDAEANILLAREKNATRETELLLIAKSVNSSLKERKAATDEILKNTATLQKAEEDIVNKKIQALELTQKQNKDDREGNKELKALQAELIALQRSGKEKELSLIKLLNKENKEQLDNAKKLIPIVEQQIEGYDEFETKIKKIEEASKKAQEEAFKLIQTFFEPEELFEEDQDVFDKILNNLDKFKLGVEDGFSEGDVLKKAFGLDERGVEDLVGAVQVVEESINGISNVFNFAIEERQRALDEQLKAGEISQQQFEEKNKELALKQFRTNKALNLGQAAIDTARGAISAFAQTPGGIVIKQIAAGIATAFGLAQVAAIAAQKPPQFAEGGEISIDGKSHDQGGEIVTVGGRPVAEVEGGEGLYVMKKNAYQKIKQFSAINEAFGGKSWLKGSSSYLQDGGAINTSLPIQSARLRVNEQLEQNRLLASAFKNLPAPELSIVELGKKTSKRDKSVRISEL